LLRKLPYGQLIAGSQVTRPARIVALPSFNSFPK
jgi:hypothetical protein